MENLNIIDDFLSTFSNYLDSGFGLLGGDVHALSTILIGIDVTLAGLFWTLGGEDDVLAKFIRKVLYIGAFAYIIGNYAALSTIIFKSFSQAGLTAAGGTITADQLLKPGRLAGTGFSAAWPLLVQASKSLGFANFFQNFLTIAVLLTAWIIVIISFFILAVQLFITILEFKLTGLAGFILVPFALWNRTNFLAERVLGNVVTSGIKVMVLAVIVGIGSTYFSQFTAALQGKEPDIGQRHEPCAGQPRTAGPWHLRPDDCQRAGRRRATAGRRFGGRHRAGCGRRSGRRQRRRRCRRCNRGWSGRHSCRRLDGARCLQGLSRWSG
jgi:type IV secretion system protein TrbL